MTSFAAEIESHLAQVIYECCIDEKRDMATTLSHLKGLADRPGTPEEGAAAQAHYDRLSKKYGMTGSETPKVKAVRKPRATSSAKTEPYIGPFPRKKHSHRCEGCLATNGSRGVHCYKGHCTKPHTVDSCSWCRRS